MTRLFLIGIIGLIAIAACWALAALLYRVGQPGSAARRLALLLVVEGVVLVTAGFPGFVLGVPDSFYDEHLVFGYTLFNVHHLADGAMLILYPLFLAEALKTNLTSIFTSKRMRIGVAIAAIILSVIPFVSLVLWDSPHGAVLLYVAVTLLFVVALVASIHAWRIAPVGPARDRARIFAIAFGIRDACWVFAYAASAWMMYSNSESMSPGSIGQAAKFFYAMGTLLAVPLIAYGILSAHLFDIDLRIRWTIKQSTLAGFIVAFIFIVSEGASEFLSEELGSVAGLLAAGVVIFFLAPLQRFAEQVAASAMPNTRNTPEYVAFRKMQVYEAALSDALDEGGISGKERALLNTLHESLGISAADAAAIESELKKRQATEGLQLAGTG